MKYLKGKKMLKLLKKLFGLEKKAPAPSTKPKLSVVRNKPSAKKKATKKKATRKKKTTKKTK